MHLFMTAKQTVRLTASTVFPQIEETYTRRWHDMAFIRQYKRVHVLRAGACSGINVQ